MSAMAELAASLVEFGGDLHTHDGWLARTADGRAVDGYRYARQVAHACGSACDRPCLGWHWHYVGRAFAEDDAVTVLVEIIAGDAARPCMCPDDCACHYPWRLTVCGCKGHQS